MNKKLLAILSLCAFFYPASQLQAGPLFSIDDEWMRERINAPTKALPVNDALLAFSNAAFANIFVDATHIDADKVLETYQNRQKSRFEALPGARRNVAINLAFQADLTFYRSNANTMLFWRKPSTQRLVELIISHHQSLNAGLPRTDETTPNALKDFFARNYGWNPKPQTVEEKKQQVQGVDASLSLAELPPELRSPVEAEIRARVLQVGRTPSYRSFDAAFWKDARLFIIKDSGNYVDAEGKPRGSNPIPFLHLATPHSAARFIIGVPHYQVSPDGKRQPSKTRPAKTKALDQTPHGEPRATANIAPLTRLDSVNEPQLQKQVTFSIKRKPLQEFLASLQKQSGIPLTLQTNKFQDALLTANSKGMSLVSALESLASLYSAHWQKEGRNYTLVSNDLDELHLLMAQEGFSAFYSSSNRNAEREEAGTQIADEIVGLFEPKDLESREGVPFSTLPAELQDRALEVFRSDSASELILAQQRLDEVTALLQELRLKLGPLPAQTPLFFGSHHTPGAEIPTPFYFGNSGFGIYTADNRFVTSIFPAFSVEKPNALDEAQEKYRLGAEAFLAEQARKGDPNP